MENDLNLISKLLANENITLQRGKFQTASFDIVNRVLRLPTMVDMSETEEFLMIFHEVGHALFTPTEYVERVKEMRAQKMRNYGSYLNVIEDVRIERKIKDMYPGSRRDFFKGYKSLTDRDFFGTNGKNLDEYSFIDRLNLFYKSGMSCGVKFTADELKYVQRCELTETFDDVIALTDEIYEFAKSQSLSDKAKLEDLFSQLPTDPEDNEEDGNGSDDDSEYDDYEDSGDEFDSDDYSDSDEEGEESEEDKEVDGDNDSEQSEEFLNEAPPSETQKKFDTSMADNTSTDNVEFFDFDLKSKYFTISFKEFTSQFSSDWKNPEYFNNIRNNIKRSASYLFREFQMKKSAHRYARQSVSKSGALNIHKLSQYKTTDDIFKKYNIVPDDQNHGMIVLLDYSGSMSRTIRYAVLELYTLATFCNMAKIPYRFYAFTDNYYGDPTVGTHHATKSGPGLFGRSMSLIEIATSDVPFKEVEFAIERMYWHDFGQFKMSNTPLSESILILDKIIPEFKKKLNLQKVSLVTMTDGAANEIGYNCSDKTHVYKHDKDFKVYIVDEINNRKHLFKINTAYMTLTKILNDRHPYLTISGYFIINHNKIRDFQSFISVYHTILPNIDMNNWDTTVRSMYLKFMQGNFKPVVPGYDSFSVFVGNTISDEFSISGITEKSTIAATTKAFANGMKNGIKNKVVLSTLVDTIA